MEATEKDELYHHGILGMKWGVRRYQNKDGSLTNAGKKRYGDEEEDSSKSTTKKSVSEMTTTELQAYKQRLQLEKDVFDLQKKVNELNPPKENAVKKMLSTMGPKLAEKVWNDVGKQALNKYLENKLKVEKPLTELDKLKEEAEKWKQKASIAKDQKNYRDDVEKYERGKERYEKERADEKLRNKRMSDLEKMAYAEDKERSKNKPKANQANDTTSNDDTSGETRSTSSSSDGNLKRREQGSTVWKDINESNVSSGKDYVSKLKDVGTVFRDNDKYASDQAIKSYHDKLSSAGRVFTDNNITEGERYLTTLMNTDKIFKD